MQRIRLLVLSLCLSFSLSGQSLLGAWEGTFTDAEGKDYRSVVIITDGYQVATEYDADGTLRSTNGGSWSLDGDQMTEVVEFDTRDSSNVGKEITFAITLTENTLSVPDGRTWTRIDDGTPGALQGAWLMSGRKRDGEISTRDTSRPRKTMKILSGTRFQWIAYNTATKQFMATGGGTYTTKDGKYTENIEFFSRDPSRAGASLEFNFELVDGDWHHSGKSSKGDPLYEIWSQRP